jgi:hypothetical protein
MGIGASVHNPNQRLQMAMDFHYNNGGRASLARMDLRVPRDSPSPMNQPNITQGVPRSRWNQVHDLTPTTTDIDLSRRLYSMVNYTFTHHTRGNTGMYAQPIRVIEMITDAVTRQARLVLLITVNGVEQTYRLLLNNFTRIRFHSR